MKLEVFKNKYHGVPLEDNGAYMSNEANQFARHIKAYLTSVAYNYEFNLVKFNVGHYYVSGFFSKNGKYVYFSREIERYGKCVDLEKNYDILIRTAKNSDDYRGGSNDYTGFKNIGRDVLRLLEEKR